MRIDLSTPTRTAEPVQPAPSLTRTSNVDERQVPRPRSVANVPTSSGETAYARAGKASDQTKDRPYCWTYLSSRDNPACLSKDAFEALTASAPKNVNGPSILSSVTLRPLPQVPSNTLAF
jgi:hypothetical protein